jgi:ABC-type transporter Mla MlaB component
MRLWLPLRGRTFAQQFFNLHVRYGLGAAMPVRSGFGTTLALSPSTSSEGEDVLRITETARSETARTFKLEGKLRGLWLDELSKLCTQSIERSEQVHLDLAAVTFADTAGVQLIDDLIRQGVTIIQCSGFIAELLQLKRK